MATLTNHIHDCDSCRMLAEAIIGGKLFDLYYCERDRTTVARYGSEGEEYSTAPWYAHIVPEWHEVARKLADLDLRDRDRKSAFVLRDAKGECVAYRPLSEEWVEVSYYNERTPDNRQVVVETRSAARYSWAFHRKDGLARVR